jgi:asparagine synthase (glutamine-hydrolysing)
VLKGALTSSGVALDPARWEGLEHVARGPLVVAFDRTTATACADVADVACVLYGYLFDPEDLARELGVPYRNAAEIVAHGYRHLGDQILTRLRGRYSLALWDSRDERGILASDLLAMETLYYWQGAGRLAFASTLKDLFSLLPATPGPDRVAFISWLSLTGGLPDADRTLFDGVFRLGPGRMFELKADGSEVRRYWQPRYRKTLRGSRDELADGLRAELERSVRRRMSARLSGVVLSGGVDSSIVTAIASTQRESGAEVKTFSAVFPGRPFDEGWKVKSLTDSLGIERITYIPEPRGALWLALTHSQQWRLPLMGVGALVDTPAVYEAAKEGADVVLDGQTGDETLGNSPYYLSDLLRQGRLIAARRLVDRWPVGRPPVRWERRWVLKHVGLKGALPPWVVNSAKARRRGSARVAPEWITNAEELNMVMERDPFAWKIGSSGPRWWRYLSDKVIDGPHRDPRIDYLRDRALAAGVVNGSPLYDFDVVDYCLSLPPDLAFANEHTRPLARHALRDLIPDDVRLSNEKADFSPFCFDVLTIGDAAGISRLLDAPDAELRAYVDMDWVRRYWHRERPQSGSQSRRWGSLIWLIVAAECWLRAQANPAFVEDLLADESVRPPAVRRVSLDDTGTFFNLAAGQQPI